MSRAARAVPRGDTARDWAARRWRTRSPPFRARRTSRPERRRARPPASFAHELLGFVRVLLVGVVGKQESCAPRGGGGGGGEPPGGLRGAEQGARDRGELPVGWRRGDDDNLIR